MQRLLGLLWLLLLWTQPRGYAQQLVWEQSFAFAPSTASVFGYLQQLSSGDYLVSGAKSNNAYPFAYARVQATGTVVYQRTGRTLFTLEQGLVPLGGTGSSLLVASVPARTLVGNNGTSRLFFQRLRPNGDTLPGVSYPVSLLEGFPTRAVREGDSVRVLTYAIDAQGIGQYALLSTDTVGTIGRVRHYLSPTYGNAYPCDLVRTARGGWLMVGELAVAPLSHPYLVETDAQGRLRRQRDPVLFANSTEERVRRSFNNLIRLRDGSGYVFSGWQKTGGQTWGFLAKLDTALNVVWTYRHPPQATPALNPSKVYELADGTLAWLAGDEGTNTGYTRTPNLYLIRVSATGQLVSQQTVSSANCSRLLLYSWQPLPGGGALVVGGYGSNCLATPGAAAAAYVARIDNATLLATTPLANRSTGASLYPNPASETTTWQGVVPAGARAAELVLSDVLGRLVQRLPVAGRGELVTQALNLRGLAPGAYACHLLVAGQPSQGACHLVVVP